MWVHTFMFKDMCTLLFKYSNWRLSPDSSFVYVDVGLGFLNLFSLPDAIKFVQKQIEEIDSLIEDRKQRALVLEQNIHLALTNNGMGN